MRRWHHQLHCNLHIHTDWSKEMLSVKICKLSKFYNILIFQPIFMQIFTVLIHENFTLSSEIIVRSAPDFPFNHHSWLESYPSFHDWPPHFDLEIDPVHKHFHLFNLDRIKGIELNIQVCTDLSTIDLDQMKRQILHFMKGITFIKWSVSSPYLEGMKAIFQGVRKSSQRVPFIP